MSDVLTSRNVTWLMTSPLVYLESLVAVKRTDVEKEHVLKMDPTTHANVTRVTHLTERPVLMLMSVLRSLVVTENAPTHPDLTPVNVMTDTNCHMEHVRISMSVLTILVMTLRDAQTLKAPSSATVWIHLYRTVTETVSVWTGTRTRMVLVSILMNVLPMRTLAQAKMRCA